VTDYLGIAEGEGIKPLNPQERKEKDYLRLPLSRRTKDIQLRVGEVLQATILEVLSPQEAIVQLPTGTVHAFIHGRLKKGDIVFLRVQETAPNLVLRIHSVSYLKNGMELPLLEILRILDLPESQFFRETVNYLKKHRTYILRDEALLIENSFTAIEESIRKDYSTDVFFSAIIFIHENKLPIDSRIFLKIAPVLSGNNFVFDLLKEFEQLYSNLPDSLRYKLDTYFSLIKSESTSLNKLLDVFLIGSTNSEKSSFYDTLIEILLIKDEDTTREIKKVKDMAKRLIQVIEGQHFVNTFGINNNSALYFYLPFPYQNSYAISKIIIRSSHVSKQSEKRIIKFTIITLTSELAEIVTTGELTTGTININFLTGSNDLANLFSKHIAELKDKLKLGAKEVSITTAKDVRGTKSGTLEEGRQQPTNFSIVV